jgi:hypothetical protein
MLAGERWLPEPLPSRALTAERWLLEHCRQSVAWPSCQLCHAQTLAGQVSTPGQGLPGEDWLATGS